MAAAAKLYTPEEKIKALDFVIEDLRWARNDPAVPEHVVRETIIQVRKDISAWSEDQRPGSTLLQLQRLTEQAIKAKAENGEIPAGHALAMARYVISAWPMIRTALENEGANG